MTNDRLPTQFRRLAMGGAIAFGALFIPDSLLAQAPAEVTFTRDVAPILQRSCQNCHRPNGGGPMSLITYEDVRPWARSIRQKTQLREMPPWFIEKNIGIQQFKNDISLSDAEIATIAAWVDGGARRGDPEDMPPLLDFGEAETWRIGEPDLIVPSPAKTIDAIAPDWYGQLDHMETGLAEDRYVKAVEVKEVRLRTAAQPLAERRKGDLNRLTVHHAHISVTRGPWTKGDPMENSSDPTKRGGFYYIYEVGQNPMFYPEWVGVKLTAGAALTFFDMHFHSVGVEADVRMDVGFVFHPKGYVPKYEQPAELLTMFGPNMELDIPGGQDNVRFDGYHVMRQAGVMLSFEPHLHSSGERMCVAAIYPNGYNEMLNCSRYNHNWVNGYAYEDEVTPLLPKGTVLHMTAWYNNTPSNPRVVDPRNWKGWGHRSIDDMFFLLPRVVRLTDEEYELELAERARKGWRVNHLLVQ